MWVNYRNWGVGRGIIGNFSGCVRVRVTTVWVQANVVIGVVVGAELDATRHAATAPRRERCELCDLHLFVGARLLHALSILV